MSVAANHLGTNGQSSWRVRSSRRLAVDNPTVTPRLQKCLDAGSSAALFPLR
jgi:hypothetical protein